MVTRSFTPMTKVINRTTWQMVIVWRTWDDNILNCSIQSFGHTGTEEQFCADKVRQYERVYPPNNVRPKANSGFGWELLPKICSIGDKASSTTFCFPILLGYLVNRCVKLCHMVLKVLYLVGYSFQPHDDGDDAWCNVGRGRKIKSIWWTLWCMKAYGIYLYMCGK